jgi:hypothetical protein
MKVSDGTIPVQSIPGTANDGNQTMVVSGLTADNDYYVRVIANDISSNVFGNSGIFEVR